MSTNRKDLMNKKFKVNQIRNAIYAYINYLKIDKQISKDVITQKLKEMGNKIALTYMNYWNPEYKDALDLMREVHRSVFKTAARVRQTESEIAVTSRSCPLCKYKRENIETPGCNILVGFIETLYDIIAKKNPAIPQIEGIIETSKIFGEKYCQYNFKIK
ncbi:MAG TPA: hypothetical protein VMV49_02310 [Candidatus Deferrimicrobium sp.]|nr:hypothetical protein [Candidatus Deferrimicrobium sp.]